MREVTIDRQTKETKISLTLKLDGKGVFEGGSGVGFFDHMLSSLAVHSGFDIKLSCEGDLYVDAHHTIEDIGIVLGKALNAVLKDKKGICRYGNSFIPMDESLAQATIDISGRPFFVFNAAFSDSVVGTMDSCLVKEFLRAFAFNADITLHVNLLYGENTHHSMEAIFKSVAHALKDAVKKTGNDDVLSSKGVI